MQGKPGRFAILLPREFDLAAGRIAGDAPPLPGRHPAVVLSASAMSRSHRSRSKSAWRTAALRARQSFGFQGLDSGLERRYRKKRWVIPIRQQYPRPLDPARRALRVALHAQARRPVRVLPTGRLLCFFSSATEPVRRALSCTR